VLRQRRQIVLHLEDPHDCGVELDALQAAGVSLTAGGKVLERGLVLVVVEVCEAESILDPCCVVVAAGQLADARLALHEPETAAVAVGVADDGQQAGQRQRLLLGVFFGDGVRGVAEGGL
jgi:hypothetical protein